ncbi:MAG TPA: GTP-binding protein, partial [Anaerolineales bacterium]|nr:GTP-binding protein [Anaerolineales bacterium]
MKEYTTDKIRNIALASHSGAGKTMLAEALLHFTGATTRMGRIEDHTTVSDFEDEEKRRSISLSTAVLPVEYKDHKVNILDTPGFTDFVGEVISAMSVADGAIIVVDAVSGAEVGTEIALNESAKFSLPRFVLINKMNRDNANFQKALESVQELTDVRLLPIQLPWGEKASFKGVIDLLSMKAYAGKGEKAEDIPAEFADAAEEARMSLMESAAEGNDELLMKYLDGQELSAEEVMDGLRGVVAAGTYLPVLVSAATEEVGVAPLLNAIIGLMPSPAERPAIVAQTGHGEEKVSVKETGPAAAYVWKTTADPFVGKVTYFKVFSGSLHADSRVWNPKKNIEERFGNVFVMRGKEQIGVKTVHAGDIGAVPKLSETTTGDSLGDRNHPLTLPVPQYPTALYRVAVTPR